MQGIYFNEFEPSAAAWLRELGNVNAIPAGTVDQRSIKDVLPDDVRGFTQCHFFAGIGGWSLALRLAGWPEDRPVWTGSCPCQPYSAAGKQKGNSDERNLWPDFFRLIRECCPDTVFGEQVEGAIRHGWLDGIQADLEGEGYAVGHCVLGAHSVGAPHIRQRLYWVANASGTASQRHAGRFSATKTGEHCQRQFDGGQPIGLEHGCPISGMANAEHAERRAEHEIDSEAHGRDRSGRCGNVGGLGDTDNAGLEGRRQRGKRAGELFAGSAMSPWDDSILIPCRDGKSRRIKPGLEPLVDGISGRVALLRGAGNAIVPQTAAAFIRAFLETEGG